MDLGSDRGDVLLNGLFHIVLSLALMGIVLFEIGAVAVNFVQVDEIGRDAARAAAAALRGGASSGEVQQAAEAGVEMQPGVRVGPVAIDHGTVTVTVSRSAPVLLADRIPPLREHLVAFATHRSNAGP